MLACACGICAFSQSMLRKLSLSVPVCGAHIHSVVEGPLAVQAHVRRSREVRLFSIVSAFGDSILLASKAYLCSVKPAQQFRMSPCLLQAEPASSTLQVPITLEWRLGLCSTRGCFSLNGRPCKARTGGRSSTIKEASILKRRRGKSRGST